MHDEALVDDEQRAAFNDESCDIHTVVTSILEPLMQSCRLSAEGLDQADTATLMINNASSIKLAIDQFPAAAATWAEQLDAEVNTWLGVLVKHEAGQVLAECGLSGLLETASVQVRHGAASEQLGLEPPTVEGVMKAFYASLFALVMPSFDRCVTCDITTSMQYCTWTLTRCISPHCSDLLPRALVLLLVGPSRKRSLLRTTVSRLAPTDHRLLPP